MQQTKERAQEFGVTDGDRLTNVVESVKYPTDASEFDENPQISDLIYMCV